MEILIGIIAFLVVLSALYAVNRELKVGDLKKQLEFERKKEPYPEPIESNDSEVVIEELVSDDLEVEITEGWVVIGEDGKAIYDFSFRRTRIDSQKSYSRLWETPKNWKGHYKKGVRCVKATRKIILK